MDSRRLTYFLTIAEEGSINRAASVLGIAQPALSRQVKLLEDELGVTLLHRTARGVQLTEAGEDLRAATAVPLRQLELAMRYAGSPLARIERGLHLGLIGTAADLLAGPLLDQLAAAFPKVVFRLTVGGPDELVKEMLRGSIDLAVTVPPADDRLFHGELAAEDLVVVGAADSDLRADVVMTFEQFVANPLVLPASRTGIRAAIENTALRLKYSLQSRFGTDSLAAMKGLVEQGHGLALLPLSACRAEIDARRLRVAPLAEPALEQRLAICVSGDTELPRGFTQQVTEMMRDEAARLIRAGAWPARLIPPPDPGPAQHRP